MSEYELSDLVATYAGALLQGQALFITVFSAYMVVAYTVGHQLTRFQTTFVTIAFILFSGSMTLGGVQALELVTDYSDQISTLEGEGIEEVRRVSNIALFLGVRILLIAGAIVFMWQVRHPKKG